MAEHPGKEISRSLPLLPGPQSDIREKCPHGDGIRGCRNRSFFPGMSLATSSGKAYAMPGKIGISTRQRLGRAGRSLDRSARQKSHGKLLPESRRRDHGEVTHLRSRWNARGCLPPPADLRRWTYSEAGSVWQWEPCRMQKQGTYIVYILCPSLIHFALVISACPLASSGAGLSKIASRDRIGRDDVGEICRHGRWIARCGCV